jgi:hypothetical protein
MLLCWWTAGATTVITIILGQTRRICIHIRCPDLPAAVRFAVTPDTVLKMTISQLSALGESQKNGNTNTEPPGYKGFYVVLSGDG